MMVKLTPKANLVSCWEGSDAAFPIAVLSGLGIVSLPSQ